ncbi:MAG: hypothetical protein PHO36_15385 [Parabacteroides sp.]|nr:hypothetical protein [Parabacteroides sp.]
MSSTWLEIEVATSGGDTNVGHVFLPSRPEYFTYDLDGNMVSGSRWNYTWDAENRLTSMTDNTTCTNDVPKRIVFEYDYQGRRIAKKVWNNTAGTGTPATYLKYLYDGWNLIAELNGNSGNALVRSYTWGLDLSGTAQGAGGVGGLLMVNAGTNAVHFPAYDLNGNVMGLINATKGIISAKYEYGPFGEVFCSVGDMASVNPFGFSTKYTDSETDLVYYGYRYYSPVLGRWMSRDPIEEQGGLNLYAFVNNDPVNKWDKLGLDISGCGIKIHRSDFNVTLRNPFPKFKLEPLIPGLYITDNLVLTEFEYQHPLKIEFGHEWIEFDGKDYGFWPATNRFYNTLYSGTGIISEGDNNQGYEKITTWDVECRDKDTFIYVMPGTLHPHGYIPLRNSFKTRTEDAKLQGGKGSGKTCMCATCDEIKSCIRTVIGEWAGGHHYCPSGPLQQNCRDFIDDVQSKCAFRKGNKI